MKSMIRCVKKRIKHRTYICFFIAIIACNSDSKFNSKSTNENIYDNEIFNPKINIFQDKYLAVSSNSDRLIKDDGKDAVLIGNVVSDFFNEEGKRITTLYSDSAIVENFSNNLKALGNVTVISDSGFTLKSNEILWNNQYKLITSKDSILLTDQSNNKIRGVGFESDMDLTNYKIFKFIGSFKESD